MTTDELKALLSEARETFCLASPGSDEEFAAYLSGFDAASQIALSYCDALREREARLVEALRAENAALAAKLAEAMRALRNTPCDCDNKEIGRWVYHIPCSRCEALARIEKMGGGDEPNSRTAPRGTVTGSGIGTHSERRGLGDGRAESDWPRLQRTWRLAAVVER